MTLAELRALAERDLSSRDLRRSKAGAWAVEALEKITARDWQGATVAIAHAIVERPDEYVPALEVLDRAKKATFKTPARAAASRENWKKALESGKLGRPKRVGPPLPRKRKPRPSTRKPGETRGRKPKNKDQEKGGAE